MVGEYLLAQKVREEQRVAESIALLAETPLVALDAEGLFVLAQSEGAHYGGRVVVLSEYGAALADSESEYNGIRMPLPEIAQVLNGEKTAYAFYGQRGGNRLMSAFNFGSDEVMVALYVARIGPVERPIGALLFASPAQDVYENLDQIQRQMVMYLALVAGAVLILSFFLSRNFTQPINNLSQGIARMSKGDLSARVKVQGYNEFSQLAEAFNMMCERLESLDNSRNQFVSNASHELKTPLTTMKIMLETLLYQNEYNKERQQECLTDINSEIDRLNSIVQDLLTLVHFDSGKAVLQLKKLSLDELLDTTLRRLEPLAKSRQIDMSLVIADEIDTMGDRAKLEQVFYNLVDNAIKYTGRGGKVQIDLERINRRAVITVMDTGVGIPKAHLPHVFDRFYRVDMARDRETGGTGLGLSIVMQIVKLHEGNVRLVQSEEDKGSTFRVELPIINP